MTAPAFSEGSRNPAADPPVSEIPGWERPTRVSHVRRRSDGIELRVCAAFPEYYAIALSPGGYLLSSPMCRSLEEARVSAELLGRLMAAMQRTLAARPVPVMPSGQPPAGTPPAVEVPSLDELAQSTPQLRGRVLRAVRQRLRLTKLKLSELAGVSPACVRRLENGFPASRKTSLRLILSALRVAAKGRGLRAAQGGSVAP